MTDNAKCGAPTTPETLDPQRCQNERPCPVHNNAELVALDAPCAHPMGGGACGQSRYDARHYGHGAGYDHDYLQPAADETAREGAEELILCPHSRGKFKGELDMRCDYCRAQPPEPRRGAEGRFDPTAEHRADVRLHAEQAETIAQLRAKIAVQKITIDHMGEVLASLAERETGYKAEIAAKDDTLSSYASSICRYVEMVQQRDKTIAAQGALIGRQPGATAERGRRMTSDSRRPGDTLTVVIRDDGPLIFCNDRPTYRSVQIRLTPEQIAAIELRHVGTNCGDEIYESISCCFIGEKGE
jgi:uncharacterized coiled-coil protein SlyX